MSDHNDKHLEQIDQALAGLARDDAPEDLVQRTLASVAEAQAAEPVADRMGDRRWATGLAAAVVAFAAVGIVYQQLPDYEDVITSGEPDSQVVDQGAASALEGLYSGYSGKNKEAAEEETFESAQLAQLSTETGAERDSELDRVSKLRGAGGRLEAALAPASAPTPAAPPAPALESLLRDYASDNYRADHAPRPDETRLDVGDRLREQRQLPTDMDAPHRFAESEPPGKPVGGVGGISEIMASTQPASADNELGGFKREWKKQEAGKDELAKVGNDLNRALNAPVPESEPQAKPDPADKLADDRSLLLEGAAVSFRPPDNQLAEQFLARYEHLDGLSYQQASGYWANTYVPGDPAMRRLEAQLRAQNPQALATTLQRNAQPFDAPNAAALGVYLHATQTAVDGPARIQLQVGLQAAERQGGLRPPMNVAIVLDLPSKVDVSIAQQVRAVLMSMNEQRQTGDRFSVTVAGVPGGTVIAPDNYRHGTVLSFIEQLANAQLAGQTLDTVDAFVAAADRLAADDDPNSVLGSSLVMLVSADGIDAQNHSGLEILAHSSAIAGMPVSVITLAGVNSSDLDDITLAGQGRLRALGTPADAAQLIDRELHSASRTVARAVRLRIQLNPGVRLVDVVGSYRLDELDAERIREAEQSIDARLSRTWGIEADRGEDEDGIQIVIPGIAAGENHVVLLDVVVAGPGAVADVQARFKDLVQMSNGVVRASLSLADANAARHTQGPLERNVLKNLLAMEIAAHAQRSARAVSAAEPAVAQVALNYALSLINQLRNSVPGWENDAELLADEQRLRGFLSALSIGNTNTLAAELEYAAYRKLLPATFNQDE